MVHMALERELHHITDYKIDSGINFGLLSDILDVSNFQESPNGIKGQKAKTFESKFNFEMLLIIISLI